MRIRLDKFLSEMGVGTRSQIKREIAKGKVKINGSTVKKNDTKIETTTDLVTFCDIPVKYERYEYFMLNKPAGVVSATEDRREKTVLDLITENKRSGLFPVGRLDKDTEGLLIITNNGELAHRLLSPKHHVEKTYFARIRGTITSDDVFKFSEGLDIGDKKPALPAKLKIIYSGDVSEIEVTVYEGRFHQVKRMFQAVGKEVIYLKRIRMGKLALDETLQPGKYRKLNEDEVNRLC